MGYETTNLLLNFQSAIVFIVLQIGTMALLPIFTRTWLLDCKYRKVRAFKRKLRKFEKGFYWNDNIRFIIEMYFELMLISMIRSFTREMDTTYEIIITALSIALLLGMLFFFLANLNISLMYKSRANVEEVEESVGTVFEDLDLRNSMSYLNTPLFLSGRIVFVFVLIFMQRMPWAQLMIICWLSL